MITTRLRASLAATLITVAALAGTGSAVAQPAAQDPRCVELATRQGVSTQATADLSRALADQTRALGARDALPANATAEERTAADLEVSRTTAALSDATAVAIETDQRVTEQQAVTDAAGLDCTQTAAPAQPPVAGGGQTPVAPSPTSEDLTRSILADVAAITCENRAAQTGRVNDRTFDALAAGQITSEQSGRISDALSRRDAELGLCSPGVPDPGSQPLPAPPGSTALGGSAAPAVDPAAPPVDQTAADGSSADVSGDQIQEVPAGSVDTGGA